MLYRALVILVNNAAEVLKKLKKLNRTKGARHFDSFDFSTLYTNIPHDLLLDSISQLISEAYRIIEGQNI